MGDAYLNTRVVVVVVVVYSYTYTVVKVSEIVLTAQLRSIIFGLWLVHGVDRTVCLIVN